MARVSRDEWAKRVQRWKDSGQTAAEFAAEVGVKANTLQHWSWALARHAREPGWEARAARKRRRRAKFIELVSPASATAISGSIEVVLPNGLTLRVPERFDADSVRRLVEVLKAY